MGGLEMKPKNLLFQKKFNFIENQYKLPEPALFLGYLNTKTDLAVYMATDNILHDINWINKIIEPFIDNTADIAFSKVNLDPQDTLWSNYLNSDTDPFNSFIYGNSSHPDKFYKTYKVKLKRKNYTIYDYKKNCNFPLIALAQCTICRKNLIRKNMNDDLDDIINYIKDDKQIAYVQNTSIYHHSLNGMMDFINKFNKRIQVSMSKKLVSKRKYTLKKKFLILLFPFYAISLLGPIYTSIKMIYLKKNHYYLIHPFATFIIFILILKNLFTNKTK